MNQMVSAAIGEPVETEVSLAYEVEVRAIGPTNLLSDDGRAVLQELIERAKTAALDVLDGSAPTPASLAALVAASIERWGELMSAEGASIDSPVQDDELEHAVGDAREAFDLAFNALKIRFEEEFPRG